MTVHQELIDAIEVIISQGASLGYAQPAAANDVYENYVWALCLEAARRQGAAISYETVTSNATNNLCFRTSPGSIYSTAHDYTHACLDFIRCPRLEAHVGIRVAGRSGVLHECDVAVLFKEESELCRAEQVHPRASRILIAAECKFYTSAIQLHLGRSFLGLTSDINKKLRYFVTNANSASVTKLIAHHDGEWECSVLPNTTEAEDLLHSFSRGFKNFKAKYL